jgi:hypothetical protein
MARLRRDKSSREKRKNHQSHMSRREDVLNQRLLVILACEGEKTEKLYFEEFFRQLKLSHAISKISCVFAPHSHTDPSGVLDDLLNFRSITGNTYQDYEQRWIVIDRDAERTGGGGHILENYMRAIERARENGVDVAWSNPSFEIWYLLHYHYRDTGIDRDELNRRLSECINKEYTKNDPTLFSILETKMGDAIRNAKRLLSIAERERQPAQINPGTRVVRLVETLRDLIDSSIQ